MARATQLTERGVHYVDCGTSGGVWGLERGYSLMIGGEDDVVTRLDPIFRTIAPGEDGTAKTAGRTRTDGTAPLGYLHCGPNGAGHFVNLTADALARSPELSEFSGRVSDSGEGRWTVEAAIDESVPTPVISAALWQRFESRNQGEFTAKVLSAMRAEFGGHVEKSS